MTVTTLSASIAYDGDGATLPFTVPFEFYDTTDLEVYLRVKTTGVETLQFAPTNYSVTGGLGAAGTVTFVVPPPATDEVHIRRVTRADQPEAIEARRKLDSAALERALDRDARRHQELLEVLTSRALLIPVSDLVVPPGADPETEIPNSVARALKILSFGADGAVTVTDPSVLDPDTVMLGAPAQTLLPLASFALWRSNLVVPENKGLVVALQAGTEAVRAALAAGAFGTGYFVTTDTQQLWYSDASTWVDITIQRVAAGSLPTPAAGIEVVVLEDQTTPTLKLATNSGDKPIRTLPPLFIDGLLIERIDATTFRLTPGSCRDSADGFDIESTANLDKVLNAAGDWTEGSAGNLIPTGGIGLMAERCYWAFVISKPDGTLDWGIDDNATATNLMNVAGAAWTAGYRTHRRFGYALTNITSSTLQTATSGRGQIVDTVISASTANTYGVTGPSNWIGGVAVNTGSQVLPQGQILQMSCYFNTLPAGAIVRLFGANEVDVTPSKTGSAGLHVADVNDPIEWLQINIRRPIGGTITVRNQSGLLCEMQAYTKGWFDDRTIQPG